jgi:hypothetical protein
MTQKAKMSESEYRKIRRIWGKGQTFAEKGVKLVARGPGSTLDIRIPLEHLPVKALLLQGVADPTKIVTTVATALGLTEASFMDWLEHAAPVEFADMVTRCTAWTGQFRSKNLSDWLVRRSEAKGSTRTSGSSRASKADRFDWDAVAACLRDGCPLEAAMDAGGRAIGERWGYDSQVARIFEERGIVVNTVPLLVDDPLLLQSTRRYLALEGLYGTSIADGAKALGLHEESLIWRLRRKGLRTRTDRDNVREMLRMFDGGSSIAQLSEYFGIGILPIRHKILDHQTRKCDMEFLNVSK